MKKTLWLIQDTFRNSAEAEKEANALDALGIEYKGFGIIPFAHNIVGLTPEDLDRPLVIRCGTLILDLIVKNELNFGFEISETQRQNFINGIFYDELRFDQAIYGWIEGLPLMNSEAVPWKVDKIIDYVFERDVFIKPSNDRKAFSAAVIEKGHTLREHIDSSFWQPHYLEETCIIANHIYDIKRECRFFCIDNDVVTGSHYRLNNETKHFVINETDEIWSIAREYVKEFHPAKVFTMDIAETTEGYKIVEYNCFNASGLYLSDDVIKLFAEITKIKESLC